MVVGSSLPELLSIIGAQRDAIMFVAHDGALALAVRSNQLPQLLHDLLLEAILLLLEMEVAPLKMVEDSESVEYEDPKTGEASAGVDPLAEDRLGRLQLTREDLQARNALVYSWCEAWGKRLVITMGGGYSKDISHSAAPDKGDD